MKYLFLSLFIALFCLTSGCGSKKLEVAKTPINEGNGLPSPGTGPFVDPGSDPDGDGIPGNSNADIFQNEQLPEEFVFSPTFVNCAFAATSEAELRQLLADVTVCAIVSTGQPITLSAPLVINRPVLLGNFNLVKGHSGDSVLTLSSNNIWLIYSSINRASNEDAVVAGLRIQQGAQVLVHNVEISGNGRGKALDVSDSNQVLLSDITIEDITASGGSGSRIEGISVMASSAIEIRGPRINNLSPQHAVLSGGQVDTRSIGILIKDVIGAVVTPSASRGAFLGNVGIGLQVSGAANANIGIAGVNVDEASTYCFFLDDFDGVLADSEARRCGRAGVAINPGLSGVPGQSILVQNIHTYDVGYNGIWSGSLRAGVLVLPFPTGESQSAPIFVTQSIAEDQGDVSMDWGFYSFPRQSNITASQLELIGGVPGQGEDGFSAP